MSHSDDHPILIISILIMIGLMSVGVVKLFETLAEDNADRNRNPENELHSNIEVTYDRYSLGTKGIVKNKIAVLVVSKDGGVKSVMFDPEDVTIAVDGSKAGRALIDQVTRSRSGKTRMTGITLFVGPDDPLAQGLVAPEGETEAERWPIEPPVIGPGDQLIPEGTL